MWATCAGVATAETWDYVYEADRFPTHPEAITDAACVTVGPWDVYNVGLMNTTLSPDGTVTLDDTDSFGATVFIGSLTDGLWSITEPATIDIRLRVDDTNPADDGIHFLAVDNHNISFGFKWWLLVNDANEVLISGEHTVGDPCAPADLLLLGPKDQWYTLRVNYDPTLPLIDQRPVLWAWDDILSSDSGLRSG